MKSFSKSLRISFDFDGTLDNEFDGTLNTQKIEIQQLCKKYLSEGHDVFIITKRYGPELSNLGLVNEHLKVWILAEILGIPRNNCFFTNREWKLDIIKSLSIERHFENSQVECEMISNIGVEVVPVEDKYWRDLVY
jgi:hypothetical protein